MNKRFTAALEAVRDGKVKIAADSGEYPNNARFEGYDDHEALWWLKTTGYIRKFMSYPLMELTSTGIAALYPKPDMENEPEPEVSNVVPGNVPYFGCHMADCPICHQFELLNERGYCRACWAKHEPEIKRISAAAQKAMRPKSKPKPAGWHVTVVCCNCGNEETAYALDAETNKRHLTTWRNSDEGPLCSVCVRKQAGITLCPGK